MQKNLHLKFLFLLLLCAWTSSKDLLVSPSGEYPSLDKAIQALLSGENLIEMDNTITVDGSSLSSSHQFPNTLIQGINDGDGSISIIFSGIEQNISQMEDCSTLPLLYVNASSPLMLSNMALFSISGFNILYTGAGAFSTINKIGTVTFSNVCFNNTENVNFPDITGTFSGNYFSVRDVNLFSMLNIIYFHDANKKLIISQCSQIIIENITFVMNAKIRESQNSALFIANDQFYDTNTNITNLQIICLPLSLVSSIVWTSRTNNTWISSVETSNCKYEDGSISLGLFVSTCSHNIEINGAVIRNTTFWKSGYNKFLHQSGTSKSLFNNFQMDSLSVNSQTITFILVNDNSSCTEREPIYFSMSNSNLINSEFKVSGYFITIKPRAIEVMKGIDMNNVTLFNNSFSMYSNFLMYIAETSSKLSTEIPPIYLRFEGLNVTNNKITQADWIYSLGGSSYFGCLEITRMEFSDFTFVNNTVNDGGNVMKLYNTHLSVSNLRADNTHIDNSGFARFESLSSMFLSNSSIANLSLSASSYFIFSNATMTTSLITLEYCHGNFDTGEAFAQVRPLILYNNTFEALKLQASSTLLISNNPNIIIHANNFSRITTNNSKILSFGNPIYFFNSLIATQIGTTVGYFKLTASISLFALAESSLFLGDNLLSQLYQSTRIDLSLEDAQNAIFFISMIGNSFTSINATNSSETAILLQNFQIPNSSINFSSNTFNDVFSDGTYYLISAANLAKTYFSTHRVEKASFEGYFISCVAKAMDDLLFGSTILTDSEKLGLYYLQADQCSQIMIEDNEARDLTTEQVFISIDCGMISKNIVLQHSTFEDIVVTNALGFINALEFLSIKIVDGSAGTSLFSFTDNSFKNISLQNSNAINIERFQGTLFSISSVTSIQEFSNNTFDSISISPRGRIMEIFVPYISFVNSSFRNFVYGSPGGAFNMGFKTLTIDGCTFENNNGSSSNSNGLFRLYNQSFADEITYASIINSTIRNNTAPYGTIIYAETLSIYLVVESTEISGNQITASGGLFYFNQIYSSAISISQTNITQTNSVSDVTSPEYGVFVFDQSDATFEIYNCNLTAIGNVAGNFIYVKGVSTIVDITGNDLSYTTKAVSITSAASSTGLLIPQFGLFEGENFRAVFKNLQATDISLDNSAIITINCNPSSQSTNYACNLEVKESKFQNLNLESNIIIINSQSPSSFGPLTMLSIIIQDTSFIGNNWWSDDLISSGVIGSSTRLVGRNPGGNDFAITITNSTFSNLAGSGGLIYNGVESMYDLILWLNNNTINSAAIRESGAIITASSSQLTSFKSNLYSTSERGVSFLLTQNIFSNIASVQDTTTTAGGSGNIIYWKSQTRGISFSLQNNSYSQVNSSKSDGAIIHVEYSFNCASVLVNDELSKEYMIFIISANNTYEYISGQNGAIVYSQGDTQLLEITFQNDSLKHISSIQNGGILAIGYVSSATISTSSSLRLLESLSGRNNSLASQTRELMQSGFVEGKVTFSRCILLNISARNGGFIYENSPEESVLMTVVNSDFTNLTAGTRGGVFWLNQPKLVVNQNNFSSFSAGLAGNIGYSISDQVDISNLAANNNIMLSSNLSIVSHGPTNLRIVFIPITHKGDTLLPQRSETFPNYPMFSNLTTYSLSQYLISLTLVHQKDPTNANSYEIVPDSSTRYLLNMNFSFPNGIADQKIASGDCSGSTCIISAPSIELKGRAGDYIQVSAKYSSDTYNQSQIFYIKLRSCIAGEITNNETNECHFCKSGTYSLIANDSECNACPIGAICNGGNSISLKPAYYRSIANSSALNIIPCNDSGKQCLGGNDQTDCSKEYTGVACSQCNFQNDYLSTGKAGACTQCYDKAKLIVFAILLLIASIAYQIIMIIVTFKENQNKYTQYKIERHRCDDIQSTSKTEIIGTSIINMVATAVDLPKQQEKEKELKKKRERTRTPGAFIVIFTSFSQISSVLSNLDIGTASTLLSISVSVGNSNTQAVFSLQCLYLQTNKNLFDALRFEILVYLFSPIVKLLLVMIFEILRSLITLLIQSHKLKRRRKQAQNEDVSKTGGEQSRRGGEEERRSSLNETQNKKNESLIRIGAVAIVLFLLEQPGIIAKLCQYLTCTKLDHYASQYYIKSQNNIECYTEQYNSFLYPVVIPALVIWGFVIPFAIFIILYRKRKDLYESRALRIILGNFYNAYSKEAYYWGVVVMIFKMSLFILDAVLTSSDFTKGIVFILVIHLYFQLFKRRPPYDSDSLNTGEKYCSVAYMVVLTMVLLRVSSQPEWVNKICDGIIMISVMGAGGYLLINIFWLYVLKVVVAVKKISQRLKNKRTLKDLTTDNQDKTSPYESEKSPAKIEREGRNLSQIAHKSELRNITDIDLTIK